MYATKISAWRMPTDGRSSCCREFEENRLNCARVRQKSVAMLEFTVHTIVKSTSMFDCKLERARIFASKTRVDSEDVKPS